jgi:Ca-activated chloride channel family protein
VEGNWDWYSWHWFSPSVLREFHWDNSIVLFLVPAVPILFILRWIFYLPLRPRFDVALEKSEHHRSNLIQFLRLIPVSFKVLTLMLALVALARPQSVNEKIEQILEGMDILLVMDVSESMQLEDLKPNRLEAAKEVAKKFIAGRRNDRIGLVVFGSEAVTVSPLSADLQLVSRQIGEINKNTLDWNGTALGNAIGIGINRLRDSGNPSKVMILLSDGENTAGILDPIVAAKLAKQYSIRINTIGIGQNGPVRMSRDSSGQAQLVQSHLNEVSLKEIAAVTGGSYFRADDTNTLTSIFLQINKMEKGKILENRFKDTKDFYFVYLYWSLLFYSIWLALRTTLLNNFLED